ncbi:MAG TPA: glycosyltransferase family 4 protein [Mucilaginibacter sp.]|nr:glycosyltransferase family 4 protein [Mucilaginibacter sp.]
MRIAAFGFRTIPPVKGAAGADKFAMELLPRFVSRGHTVTAYNRRYSDVFVDIEEYKGVKIKTFRTSDKTGFDTLVHSFKATWDIIVHNTADIVHVQNGGNSFWALFLRMFGKKVFVSQDGVDWKRDKWPWYGKLYLQISSYITAYLPNEIIFDNVIAKGLFEKKFNKKFEFIPFGSEVAPVTEDESILEKLGLKRGEYYLFVGRFIPDKGLHYLIPGFMNAKTNKKLVLVGGEPNPSPYEEKLRGMADDSVVFAGFIYGDDVTRLMKYSYCYIQPSDIEGLSPVILSVMGLGVPIIVSDIEENQYAVQDTAIMFKRTDIDSLTEQITFAENNYPKMKELAARAQSRALSTFNWDKVADDHIEIFSRN